jgi:hypothetical protein
VDKNLGCVKKKDADNESHILDSTIAKVHQHAAGGFGGKSLNGIGKTRGGWGTKIHAVVDALGYPRDIKITEGQINDNIPAIELLKGKISENVIADKAYDTDEIRSELKRTGKQAVIPNSAKRSQKYSYDIDVYKDWTGGLGRLMINISDTSLEAVGLSDKVPGMQQTITEKIDLDAFTARYPRASTRSIEKFYDNYADATARIKSLKYAEKLDLETEENQEQAYTKFEKIYDYNTLQQAYKAIQNCQREINNIWSDPLIDQTLKKQMIDDLYLQMIEFAKVANEDIRQYRLI